MFAPRKFRGAEVESLPRDGYGLTSWEILPGVTFSAPGCISDRPAGLDKVAGLGGVSVTTAASARARLQRCSATAKARAMRALPGAAGLERDFHACVVVEFGRQDDDVGEFLTERGEATRVGMGAHPSPRRPRTPNRGPTLT